MASRSGPRLRLVSQFRKISPHRRFRTPKSDVAWIARNSRTALCSPAPVLLQVGEIGRQSAPTISARTNLGELFSLDKFGYRLFIHAQHPSNRGKTPTLLRELAHFLIASETSVATGLVDTLCMRDDDGCRGYRSALLFMLLLLSAEGALDRVMMTRHGLF
jgi:hypothetical protein